MRGPYSPLVRVGFIKMFPGSMRSSQVAKVPVQDTLPPCAVPTTSHVVVRIGVGEEVVVVGVGDGDEVGTGVAVVGVGVGMGVTIGLVEGVVSHAVNVPPRSTSASTTGCGDRSKHPSSTEGGDWCRSTLLLFSPTHGPPNLNLSR
jgi:hypothetical protein